MCRLRARHAGDDEGGVYRAILSPEWAMNKRKRLEHIAVEKDGVTYTG